MNNGLPPEIVLALAYAREHLRADFSLVFQLDARLGAIVRAAREPQLARIRLAWWAQELAALDDETRERRDPLLIACAGLLRRHDVSPEILSGISDGWACLLDTVPLPPDVLADYARLRGGGLFGIGAAMAGLPGQMGVGEAFALIDFARHCADPQSRGAALSLAGSAKIAGLPMPLAVLARWSRADHERLSKGASPMGPLHRAFVAARFALLRF